MNAKNMSSATNVPHPGKFPQGKWMNSLAFRNQSQQSHDHRYEQYPLRDGDKREEVIKTLHINAIKIITYHKSKWWLALSSNWSLSSVCRRRAAFFLLLTMYLSIHLAFVPSSSPSSCPVCCSAAAWAGTVMKGEMEGWREAQRRRGADYYTEN